MSAVQPGMTDVFIIQNQNALFLSKQGDWINGKDTNALYRTPYKDEAINTKVEQSVRDPSLRLRTLVCSAGEKGQLLLAGPTEGIDPATLTSFIAAQPRSGSPGAGDGSCSL